MALMMVASCDKETAKKEYQLRVSHWLDVCSPFESLDGQRMLVFRIRNHTVVLTEATGDQKDKGALRAKQRRKTEGTWSANDVSKVVDVNFDGVRSQYALVVTFGEGACILTVGPLNAVDLTASWFGEPDFTQE